MLEYLAKWCKLANPSPTTMVRNGGSEYLGGRFEYLGACVASWVFIDFLNKKNHLSSALGLIKVDG